MSLTSISIILSVFVSRIHHPSIYTPPISRGMYRFMTFHVAYYVGMSSTVKKYEAQTNSKPYKICKRNKISNIEFINSITKKNPKKFCEIHPLPVGVDEKKGLDRLPIIKKPHETSKCKNELEEKIKRVATEWQLIGLIVDRVLFWSFAITCFFSSMLTLVVLPILKHRDII